MTAIPGYVTVQQLAGWLGVDDNSVRRHCRLGHVAAERVPVDRLTPQPRRHQGRKRYVWRIDAGSAREFARGYYPWRGTGPAPKGAR